MFNKNRARIAVFGDSAPLQATLESKKYVMSITN